MKEGLVRAVRHPEGANRGQAILLIALMLPLMLGMAGLVVDGGMLLVARRTAQTAADAATYAAAYDLLEGKGAAAATASALYYAAENGYNNDGTTNTVTVSIPPTSGPHAGDSNFAQVRITATLSTLFIQVLSGGSAVAAASAVGGTTGSVPPYSILALDPSAPQSLNVTGSGNFNVGGGIMVDSNASTNAFNLTGSGNVQAASIDVVGGFRQTGSGTVSPTPHTGAAAVPDPLASLSAPDLASLTVQHGTASNPSTLSITGSSPVTLQPGIYYGGIKITGSGNVTLQPGIYVMAGGGFTVTGSGSLTGSGIFFYNTQDPTHPTGSGAYGGITITGSGAVNLTPPTSGSYENLLFFQDRNNTNTFKVTGSGALNSQGTLYLPSALVDITGSGDARAMQIICDEAKITGSGNLNIPYNTSYFYSAPRAALVQ